MDRRGLEANQRNPFHLRALEVGFTAPGCMGHSERSAATRVPLLASHGPPPPGDPFLAPMKAGPLSGSPCLGVQRRSRAGVCVCTPAWGPAGSPSCSVVTASVSALKSLSPMSLVAFRRSL